MAFRFFIGALFLSFFHYSFGQIPEVNTVDWYIQFFTTRDQDSSDDLIIIAREKLKIAQQTNDPEKIAAALKEIGLINMVKAADYPLAMDHFIKALELEDSLEMTNGLVFTYLAMARLCEEVGANYKSAEFLEQALEFNSAVPNKKVLVLVLNQLGKIHARMGKLEEAFENYRQVLTYSREINATDFEAEAYYNLANLFTKQNKYEEALASHKEALTICRATNDRFQEARSLNTIGELYQLMRNEGRAMANFIVALNIRKELNQERGLSESYNNVGVIYFERSDFSGAIANLKLGLSFALKSQSQEQIRKSYRYLSYCYEKLGDYKEALKYKDLTMAITHLIQGEQSERQLLEAQNRYIITKKQHQINKLEQERILKDQEIAGQAQTERLLFSLLGLGVVVIVLGVWLYVNKQRSHVALRRAHIKEHKQHMQLRELNATKDRFFSIISHDLKGPLNSLSGFSNMLINHTDDISKEEIKMLAVDFDKTLKNLFSLLENLLEWARSQTGHIDYQAEIFNLTALLNENMELLTPQAKDKNITIMNECSHEINVNAHRNSINTVVRNLLSNAIKFTREGGAILLGVKRSKYEIVVSISDTGLGMSPEVLDKLFKIELKYSTKGTSQEKGTGLGLILCKEFVEKNGGRIWVESEESRGSVFYFTLPYV